MFRTSLSSAQISFSKHLFLDPYSFYIVDLVSEVSYHGTYAILRYSSILFLTIVAILLRLWDIRIYNASLMYSYTAFCDWRWCCKDHIEPDLMTSFNFPVCCLVFEGRVNWSFVSNCCSVRCGILCFIFRFIIIFLFVGIHGHFSLIQLMHNLHIHVILFLLAFGLTLLPVALFYFPLVMSIDWFDYLWFIFVCSYLISITRYELGISDKEFSLFSWKIH